MAKLSATKCLSSSLLVVVIAIVSISLLSTSCSASGAPGSLLSGSAYPLTHSGSTFPSSVPTSSIVTNAKIPLYVDQFYFRNSGPWTIPTALIDGDLTANYLPGWSFLLSPSYLSQIVYEFPSDTIVRTLNIFDLNGAWIGDPHPVQFILVFAGSDAETLITTWDGGLYNTWRSYPIPAAAQRLVKKLIIRGDPTRQPAELQLIGDYVPYVTPTYVPKVPAQFNAFIGVNGFEWDFYDNADFSRIGAVAAANLAIFAGSSASRNASGVSTLGKVKGLGSTTATTATRPPTGGFRHYLDWTRLQAVEGVFVYGGSQFQYDRIYTYAASIGLSVVACIKQTTSWIDFGKPASELDGNDVPIRKGADPSLPASYIDLARQAFQFAARYGRNSSIPRRLILTDKSLAPSVGLNLVQYMELGNERDGSWNGRRAFQLGSEYAAMLSATYDGDQGRLGEGIGAKVADPTMMIVVAGMAGPNASWMKDLLDWCILHRGYLPDGGVDLPFNIVNFHQYSQDGLDTQYGSQTRGVAPELSNVALGARAMLNLVQRELNSMQLWITELGFDVNQASTQRAWAIAANGKQGVDTQADWILRSLLLYARIGLDRAAVYMLDDVSKASSGTYSSSGLLEADGSRRPSMDFLLQASKVIGTMSYANSLSSDPAVDRYTSPGAAGSDVYAAWIPDEVGRVGSYTFLFTASTAAQSIKSVQVFNLIRGQNDPMVSTISIDVTTISPTSFTSSFSVSLSETPIFVLASSTRLTPSVVGGPLPGPTPAWIYTGIKTVQLPPTPSAGATNNYTKGQALTLLSGSQFPLSRSGSKVNFPPGSTPTSGIVQQNIDNWFHSQSGSPIAPYAFTDGILSAAYIPGSSALVNPNNLVYEFPSDTILDSVCLYHAPGFTLSASVQVLLISVGSEVELNVGTWDGARCSGCWYNFTISSLNQVFVRRLVLRAQSHSDQPAELVLMGMSSPYSTPVYSPRLKQPFSNMAGINGFEWDFYDATDGSPHTISKIRSPSISIFSGFRHYLDWSRLEGTTQYVYTTSGAGQFDYDIMYGWLHASNITTIVVIQSMVSWMQASYLYPQSDLIPTFSGRDPSLPSSYIEIAQQYFQFAARYGSNKNVNVSLLSMSTWGNWDPEAVKIKVGLGTVSIMEADNERDKDWKGAPCYQTGAQHAAHLSAMYDGHKGTLGANVGIKAADVTMRLSTTGSSRAQASFFIDIIDWCRLHRGYLANGQIDLPFDIINYHEYSFNAASTSGMAPELSNVGADARKLVAMSNTHAYGTEVWLTELGFDTNAGSSLRAPSIGSKSTLDTSADWTLRSMLMYARWGVDRIFFYMLDDDDPSSSGNYESSGFVLSPTSTNQPRKPNADFVLQAQNILGKMYLQTVVANTPAAYVDLYSTSSSSSASSSVRSAYVMWIPDQIGRVGAYTLALPSSATSITIYTPTKGQATASARTMQAKASVVISISETPIFVTVQ